MLLSFLLGVINGSSLVKQFACMHGTHGRYNFFYMNYYSKSWQCKLGKSDLHPISPKIPTVLNCFVYILMLTTDITKHLFDLSIYRTVSRKYLIKLFLQCQNL